MGSINMSDQDKQSGFMNLLNGTGDGFRNSENNNIETEKSATERLKTDNFGSFLCDYENKFGPKN